MILDAHGQPIRDDPHPDTQILGALVAELQTCDEPLVLGPLDPLEALQLAGLIQLARRHPHLSDAHTAIAAAVVDTVRAYFEGRPAILEVLDRGDDPAQDVPR